jgi:glycosyltransferase involved in cell wall biosynthesis
MLPVQRLRVAFVAGTLARGGAEKQLFYMMRTLVGVGVDVRVCSLGHGEFFETELQRIGISPIWIGHHAHPVLRTVALLRALANFRPHIVQAAHFYTNLYVAAGALPHRALGLGAIRSDTYHEAAANGGWGRWLLHLPSALLANSQAAKQGAELLGVRPERVYVVGNVIDLPELDRSAADYNGPTRASDRIVVASVARHARVKRLERFLMAVARARVAVPEVFGLLIGTGPEHEALRRMAQELGLDPHGVAFLGMRDDVPGLLRAADLLLMTSDEEGFPNAILEAMAARLPVITTPAGDAGLVVQDNVTGYVVPFDDIEQTAERIVRLARSPELRRSFGQAGRLRVERCYSYDQLPAALLGTYRSIAIARGQEGVLKLIPRIEERRGEGGSPQGLVRRSTNTLNSGPVTAGGPFGQPPNGAVGVTPAMGIGIEPPA